MFRQKFILVGLLLSVAAQAAWGQVVARVNGEEITRSEFGLALVRSLGGAVLDSVVDRLLVEQEARHRGITVTAEELLVRAELERELRMRAFLQNARMGLEEFRRVGQKYDWDVEELQRELWEGISDRTLRPRLLCEKMLAPWLDLSEQAVRDHFDRTRGPRFTAAHIMVADLRLAENLIETLRRDTEFWSAAVLRYSLDRASVPYKGRMRPVPADSRLGQVLAQMEPGRLKLHKGGEHWHVLQLIGTIPATEEQFDDVKDKLRAELLAVRSQEQDHRFLAELNHSAAVVTNLSTKPRLRRLLGEEVAAYVNGEAVLVAELADALMRRFGNTMLESYIERLLIRQEADRLGVTVSPEEVDERMEAVATGLFGERAFRRSIPPQEMEELVADQEVAVADFKEVLVQEMVNREDVQATLLAERIVADDVEVSEEQIQEAYEGLFEERFLVRRMTTETAARAQQLHRNLQQGTSFELLLEAESGQLGAWLKSAALLSVTPSHPYHFYVKDLKEGQTSSIFKHGDKYHIIKVVRRLVPAERAPFDPSGPSGLEELGAGSVRDALQREVFLQKATDRIRALLIRLKAESDIQIELAALTEK